MATVGLRACGAPLRALVWCARVPSSAWELLRTSLLALGSGKWASGNEWQELRAVVGFNTSNHIYGSISKSKENCSYFSFFFVFRVILELLEHSLSYWRSPDCYLGRGSWNLPQWDLWMDSFFKTYSVLWLSTTWIKARKDKCIFLRHQDKFLKIQSELITSKEIYMY